MQRFGKSLEPFLRKTVDKLLTLFRGGSGDPLFRGGYAKLHTPSNFWSTNTYDLKLSSIIAHNKIFLFYQKNLECDVIFGWRHHFCWWRHQKSVKIRPKLKIRQILNRLSSQSGWPIKLKLVHRPVLQTGFGYTCPHSFVLTSAYLMMTSSKICQKLKIRQHDVIKSDFQKNFRKCSTTSYYVCVQRWSHLEHVNGSYSIFRIVRFSMGIIGKC